LGFRASWRQSGNACTLHHLRDFRLGGPADHAAARRGLSIAGFAIVFVSLLIAAAALYTDHVWTLAFAAAAMLWEHYWDAENVVTIPAMVARPEYRGTATGFAFMFVKLPAFLSILFPVLLTAIGQANVTLFTARFPLAGLLAAIFILPWLGWRRRAAKLVLRILLNF
jgi:hypothetical protein